MGMHPGKAWLALPAMVLLVTSAITTAAGAPATMSVDTSRPGAKIDPDIFGQFAEHLGTGIYGGIWIGKNSKIANVRGIRSDVVQALRAIKVPNVRWPGGCFADEYHWRDGIGPQSQRTVTVNSNWGGVPEPSSFGTEEFMDFIGQIGSEAFISVNVGSGTPEEAAGWLEYMTSDQPTTLVKRRAANGHPAPYKIKYLGLGNENWGCGGAMSADHYVEEMKRFSHYVRNTNPAQKTTGLMKRIAVGSDGGKSDYTETVMKAWADKAWSWDIDGVSLHSYSTGGWPPHLPSTGFGEGDYALLLKETLGMDDLIIKQSAIMDKYDPAKKLALVVDEWGAWLSPTPGSNPGFLQQQNTMRDGVLAALNINIFIRHADRVRATNIAQMINVLQAMILTDGPKMVLTPTYHVYKMYVPFQNATMVPVKLKSGTYTHAGTSMAQVDGVAARDASGKLWLAATNVDPNMPAKITLDIAGVSISQGSGEVLTAPKVDSMNSFDAPNVVVPKPIQATRVGNSLHLTLPPKSVAVLSLR